ncbi:MAG: hypothetical protein WCS43_16350, partial [Verrucomicrobiota bacterium]
TFNFSAFLHLLPFVIGAAGWVDLAVGSAVALTGVRDIHAVQVVAVAVVRVFPACLEIRRCGT